jgi:predicted DNA-binding transcriptional regulator AlpA
MIKHYEDYPMILTARDIADIVEISRSSAYDFMNAPDFPLIKFSGSRIKRVQKKRFFEYLDESVSNLQV